MNSTSIFRFSLGFLMGTFIILIFASYGNKQTHPTINGMIVSAFIKKNNILETVIPEFKHYSFLFNTLNKGTAVTKDGFFHTEDLVRINTEVLDDKLQISGIANIFDIAALYGTDEEGPAEMSVTEWIVHGGYSADVPEVPASLRHFYDPTTTPGLRYLLDITNAKLMGYIQLVLTNPEIDGVDWALGNPGDLSFGVQYHTYTWEKGKVWMKGALQEKDESKRSELMGKAWRALGETLHMIADNGCPPHVRNDAHPSPLCNNNLIFGNPDPYEEYVDQIRTKEPEVFDGFANGNPDNDLKARMDRMKTTREIAHALAVFTNLNFVTNETISGKDKDNEPVKQVINSSDPYPAPLLENMKYNAKDFTYRSPSGVKQCMDHDYSEDIVTMKIEPYVDMECVKSQAAALIPNIIAAGVNVMQLFIPKLTIELQPAGKDAIKGAVIHTTDLEYTSEIKYNGDVTICLKDKDAEMIREKVTVNVRNGLFEMDGLKVKEGDQAYAEINFGGVSVKSEEVNLSDTRKIEYSRIHVTLSIYAQYLYENYQNIKEVGFRQNGLNINNEESADNMGTRPKLSWQGNSFSMEFKSRELPDHSSLSLKISGRIDPGSPQTVSGKAVKTRTSTDYYLGNKVPISSVESIGFTNVPCSEKNEFAQYFSVSSKNADVQKYIINYCEKEERVYPQLGKSKKEMKIDWSHGGKIEIFFH
ncbi:MAG: hypothetical protein NTX61_10965 [Bacteroidetes bacterium]|nr:hypothetical protein [Bacteroidota bacterium]